MNASQLSGWTNAYSSRLFQIVCKRGEVKEDEENPEFEKEEERSNEEEDEEEKEAEEE